MKIIFDQDIVREKIRKYLNSQSSLSKEIGIDKSYLSRFLNGGYIGVNKIIKINNWLNTKKHESD